MMSADLLMAGATALCLLFYLVVALLRPDRF